VAPVSALIGRELWNEEQQSRVPRNAGVPGRVVAMYANVFTAARSVLIGITVTFEA
jgi:hypothetical protein